jgi:hypothetical protein
LGIFDIAFSQGELTNISHPVYKFLLKSNLNQFTDHYDHFVLPKSRLEIIKILKDIDTSKKLSLEGKAELQFYLQATEIKSPAFSLYGEHSSSFEDYISNISETHFYSFHSENYNLSLNPVLSIKQIFTDEYSKDYDGATLITYGAKAIFNYSDWFCAFFEGWNGYQGGNRNAAFTDKRVKQSYSFNKTKIRYFDGTKGYVNISYDIFSLFFGHDDILIGAGDLNRVMISNVSPSLDYIKFSLSTDIFKYTFLHGWLNQKPSTTFIDTIVGDIKRKSSKYIAMSRLSLSLSNNIRVGLTQTIIYGNRPIEAAYLNPFLLWESAQRSMNDLDNSFLSLDFRFRIFKGIEINSLITLDDLNFDTWGNGKWNTMENRLLWQIGFIYNLPLTQQKLTLHVDYLQIRPYTFSHPEVGDVLAYTNNGYPIGVDAEPNSILTSFRIDYDISPKLLTSISYRNKKHGSDIYDKNGKLMRIVGGSYNLSTNFSSSDYAKILDGSLESTDEVQFIVKYYYSYNLNFLFGIQYKDFTKETNNHQSSLVWFQTNLNIF